MRVRRTRAKPVFWRGIPCQLPNSGLSPNLVSTCESMSPRRFSKAIFENFLFGGHLPPKTSKLKVVKQVRLWGEGLVWLIGAMVCLLAALWVQLSVSAGNGWPHTALRHHWLMPISCHFRDCKALLVTSLTHVNGAIASAQTFTFTFTCSLRDALQS